MPDSPPTRQTLILRIRDSRDTDAWSEFVDLYTPMVYGFLIRRGLQKADAADTAQEVFHSVFRSIDRFCHQGFNGSFRSWLLTVTRNKLLDHLSRRHAQVLASGGEDNLDQLANQPVSSEEHRWIEKEHQRRVFEIACQSTQNEFQTSTWAAFWETQVNGRSSREVAVELQMSVDAVYVARSRVISRLRDRIREIDI